MSNIKFRSIFAMACGIASIIFSWMGYGAIVAIPHGIIAIIFAATTLKMNPRAPFRNFCIAGLITGIVGTALGAIVFTCSIVATAAAATYYNAYNSIRW